MPFVPEDFDPPTGLDRERFRLRPLGPEHNDSDQAAWSSSIDHIHATPGWESSSWPSDMTAEENLADLVRHAGDFAARAGFTFTVLTPGDDEVIGCVYIYPSKKPDHDAVVMSWVRAEDAELDAVLYREVSDWLATEWPFRAIDYAARG